MLSIAKSMVMIAFAAHWFACVWALQANVQDDKRETWLGAYGHCVMPPNVTDPEDIICTDHSIIYSSAVYWATMTITSIGYGDIVATPGNSGEHLTATILMLSGAMIWGQVIGTFCGVIAAFNPELTAFHRTMDELNRFMRREDLPDEMRRRLREYFHQSNHLRMAEQMRRLLSSMPPSLKAEVAFEVNQQWLERIWFLRSAPPEFMLQLSMQFHAIVFTPGDAPPRGYLYVIHRGIVLYRAKLLHKGQVWGEDMILTDTKLRDPAIARAMNYVAVYYINRTELLAIASHFPETHRRIRKSACWLALKRTITLAAAVKRAKDLEHSMRDDSRARSGRPSSFEGLFKARSIEDMTRTVAGINKSIDLAAEDNTFVSGSSALIAGTTGETVGGASTELEFESLQEEVRLTLAEIRRESREREERQAAEFAATVRAMGAAHDEKLAQLTSLVASLAADPRQARRRGSASAAPGETLASPLRGLRTSISTALRSAGDAVAPPSDGRANGGRADGERADGCRAGDDAALIA